MQATMQNTLTEEQKLTDLLCSEKFFTSVYNTYCCEAASNPVKNCLSSILADEHRIQEQIFCEMQSRGWYPLQKAEESKIMEARQKFSGFASN